MCNETLVAQIATYEVVPIVLCILRAWRTQTSTLNRRASVRARGRAPAWECATKQRASANVTCNTRVGLQQGNHGGLSCAHIQGCHGVLFLRHQRVYSQQL